jgi:hypothetical protein
MNVINTSKGLSTLTATFCFAMLTTSASAAERDTKDPETRNCSYFDFDRNGGVNIFDYGAGFHQLPDDTDQALVYLINSAFAAGCADAFFSMPGPPNNTGTGGEWLGQVYLDFHTQCVDYDSDSNGLLDYSDLQNAFNTALSVRGRQAALKSISGRNNVYEFPQEGQPPALIALRCHSINPTSPLVVFPGLYDTLSTQLAGCFPADVNGDNVLNDLDTYLIVSPRVNLTIPQRVNYLRAVQDPLCSGPLETEEI